MPQFLQLIYIFTSWLCFVLVWFFSSFVLPPDFRAFKMNSSHALPRKPLKQQFRTFFMTTQGHFSNSKLLRIFFPFLIPSLYFPTSCDNLFQLTKSEMHILQLPTRAIMNLLEMQLTNFPGMRKQTLEIEILVS